MQYLFIVMMAITFGGRHEGEKPANLIPFEKPEDVKVVRVCTERKSDEMILLAPIARSLIRRAGLTAPDSETEMAHVELRLAIGTETGPATPIDILNPAGESRPIMFIPPPRPPEPVRRLYIEPRLLWLTPKPVGDPLFGPIEPNVTEAHGVALFKADGKAPDGNGPLKAVEDSDFALEVAWFISRAAGKSPVEILSDAMTDKLDIVRAFAASSLGQSGKPQAVAPLVKAAAEDESVAVRESAIKALGRLGPPAIESLIAILKKHKDPEARAAAAVALARMAAPPSDPSGAVAPPPLKGTLALAALIAALDDPEPKVRLDAAFALGMAGDLMAVSPLIARLKDKDVDVRMGTAVALGRLKAADAAKPLAAALEDESPWVRQVATWALIELKDGAAAALEAALKFKTPEARGMAATALGRLKSTQSVDALLPLLEDEWWKARAAAAQTLGLVGNERVIGPLVQRLKDSDPSVRHAAVWALGTLANPAAAEALDAATQDFDREVAQEALNAYRACGGGLALGRVIQQAVKDGRAEQALALMKRTLRENDPAALVVAIQAVSEINDPEVAPLLVSAMRSASDDVFAAAATALGRLKAVRAVEPLASLYLNGAPARAPVAAAALAEIGDPRAIPYLEAKLRAKDLTEDLRTQLQAAIDKIRNAKP
jgi:HEAT repeat protein